MSVDLSELDSDIADIRQQLASFEGQTPDDTLVALPEDWTPQGARADLDQKLLDRFKLASKLDKASKEHEATRKAENQAAFAELAKRNKAATIALLKAAVKLAEAIAERDAIMDEAQHIKGCGHIPCIGPSGRTGHFSLRDHSSFVAHWARESVSAGYVRGTEEWLAGVMF
jgi:hypothetical protein